MYAQPPPPYYNKYPKKYRKRSCASSCRRCIYCWCCFFFILILLILASIFITWSIYDPKPPTYTFQDLKIKDFAVQPDLTLKTDLEMSVQAENPNKHLGILYGDKNSVEVKFHNVTIGSGNFPGFRQGTENVAVIKFELKGNTVLDPTLQQAFNESHSRHEIPLDVDMKVPVSLLIGKRPLREVRAILNCTMVVDTLLAPNSTDAKFTIKDKSLRFEF